jgi:hypothetical protein
MLLLNSSGTGYLPELPDSVLAPEPPLPVEELLLWCFFFVL